MLTRLKTTAYSGLTGFVKVIGAAHSLVPRLGPKGQDKEQRLDERGAMVFLVIAITLGLLLFVPIFIDYASLHFARRVAETGADAAALAAAVEFADTLSIDTGAHLVVTPATELACCSFGNTDGNCELGIYDGYVAGVVLADAWPGDTGEDLAQEYAQANGTELEDYTRGIPPIGVWYAIPRFKFAIPDASQWIPVPPVGVEAKTQRNAPMIYKALYGGGDFKAPGQALAEAFVNKVEDGFGVGGWLPCWCGDKCFWVVRTWEFKWKVRLVE